MTMLDINNLPSSMSLDLPEFSLIRECLLAMRDRDDYADVPSSTATLSAAQFHPLLPDDAGLHVVLVDVPGALDALVSDWLRGTPVPDWYGGEMQETFTCLRFESDYGASLCVDVEDAGIAVVEAESLSTKLLICVGAGSNLHFKLLGNAMLRDEEFALSFKQHFYDGSAMRSNHYRHIARGEWDTEPMNVHQCYEGTVYVAAKSLRLHDL